MNPPSLPDHAVPFFAQLPWVNATKHQVGWNGLPSGHFFQFAAPSPPALFAMTRCNVDTDGPLENSQVDPCWQPDTSLLDQYGNPVSSQLFPGAVMPPELRTYGVRLGDFGVAEWRGALVPFQFYDGGPHDQWCEYSLYCTRLLGATPITETDHRAAVDGNEVADVCVLAFPGSGPGFALAPEQVPLAVAPWAARYGIQLPGASPIAATQGGA